MFIPLYCKYIKLLEINQHLANNYHSKTIMFKYNANINESAPYTYREFHHYNVHRSEQRLTTT